jgi:hypothetical protein
MFHETGSQVFHGTSRVENPFICAANVESAEGIGLISDKTDWGRRLEGVVVHPW